MDWKPWLSRWSEEWVRSADPDELDAQVMRDHWLGFAPAPSDALTAAEARIGRSLPPSYRDFLLTTDGWREAGSFVSRMRDTSDLGWLRDIEPEWEEHFSWCYEDDPDSGDGSPFRRGLLISLHADAGILFLDAGDVDDTGEWAAYSLFSWEAAPPTRYASFAALMQSLYAEFHRTRQPEGETRDGWDAVVEQARLDALSGDIDGAAAALEQAEEFGRTRATILRVQLRLFLDPHYEGRQLLAGLVNPSFTPAGFLTDPLFTEEFLPWMFTQHAKNTDPYRASILEIAIIGERPEIHRALGEHETRLERSGGRPNYGNPAFDARIRQALDEHATDPDALWQAVRAALVHWRPRTTDHLAPVALLADPVLAEVLTPERGRELLSMARGDR